MAESTSEQEKRALEDAPKGTFALMLLLAAVFVAAWVYLYFGRFLGHGPVS